MPNPIHQLPPPTQSPARTGRANLPGLKLQTRRRQTALALAVTTLVLLFALLAIPLAPAAQAAILIVNTLADASDGSCLDGDCSLRDAIALAAPGDEITFSVTGTITLTGELVINKDLTITGPEAGTLALDGNDAGRIFKITSGYVTISNLALQNGRSAGEDGGRGTPGTYNGVGGAMYIAPAATVSLSDLTFDGNTAVGGRGGHAAGGTPAGGGGGVGGAGAPYNSSTPGGNGGFGGGGGGGGMYACAGCGGGDGGFGGGGGGGGIGDGFVSNPGGSGGTGGGAGGAHGLFNGYGAGGGGAGMGGAIFNEGLVAIQNVSFTNNTARGGDGGNGSGGGGGGGGGGGLGSAIFNKGSLCLQSGNTFSANVTAGGSGGSRVSGNPGSPGSGLDTETGIYYDESSDRSCSVTTAEDTSYSFTPANFPFNDPDGHTFDGIRIVTVQTAGDLQAGGVDVAAGQVVADVTSLVFSPAANAHGSPYATFTFRVRDSSGAESVATYTMTINVTPVDDDPTGGHGSVTTAEDTSYSFTPANFPFNDLDGHTFDGIRIVTVQTAGDLEAGGVDVTANQVITNVTTLVFSPAANAHGSPYVSFTFRVRDSSGAFSLAIYTMTINVTPVNDAPVIAEGDTIVVTMDEDGSPIPFSLTLHASDVDGDTLTWSIKTQAGHGMASASGTGTSIGITYTPQADYNGPDSFEVQVGDGNGGLDTITVNLTINPQNDPPVIIEGDSIMVIMDEDGSPTAFNLTLHASDADGDTLTWSIKTQAGHGTASASGTGISMGISYTPQANYNGPDSFVVQVADGAGHVAIITVNVRITPRDEPPIFLPLLFKDFSLAPNLIVESLTASSNHVTLVVRNAGNAPVVDAFWVDVYFNPGQTPALNQPWQSIAGAGAVWGVTRPLQPSERLTLTTGGDYYMPGESSSSFPAGAEVYAYVDSINHSTGYGNVQESNEADNLFGPVTSTQAERAAMSQQGQSPSLNRLPHR